MNNEDEYGVNKGEPDPFTGAIIAIMIVIFLALVFFT